jgi:hypothetical protein
MFYQTKRAMLDHISNARIESRLALLKKEEKDH